MFTESKPKHSKHTLRFITAGALFDGHDAAINVMRRVLQAKGAEVIHLGHNRSALEIVEAAIQEDVDGIGISSYQGGHNEFFKYIIDLLKEKGASHIRVFGGGGGVILPSEIKMLEAYGVTRIYSPEDGRQMGLEGMINDMLEKSSSSVNSSPFSSEDTLLKAATQEFNTVAIAKLLTLIENEELSSESLKKITALASSHPTPVLGITGTGGAGKSSLTDELILRIKQDFPDTKVAILAIDPTKRKTGGALLGDRIRMNAISGPKLFMRSLATRGRGKELSKATHPVIIALKASGFDFIIVETSGIGQGDAEITQVSDLSLYVMTSEYGAPSQLEKIDMLDLSDLVAINKFERRGSEDAKRDVIKQIRRSQNLSPALKDENIPVFGTIASRFNDSGVNALYDEILNLLKTKCHAPFVKTPTKSPQPANTNLHQSVIPVNRIHYLGEIVQSIRDYKVWAHKQAQIGDQLWASEILSSSPALKKEDLLELHVTLEKSLDLETKKELETYRTLKPQYQSGKVSVQIRDKSFDFENHFKTLSGSTLPKVSLPKTKNTGDLIRFLLTENLPGSFPYTAGVFPFKRDEEEPKRMFAGEGLPERTNKRFHYLCEGEPAKRLSTAFDSVTLYGEDPHERPDIYGKIGESGVSVATLEDMKTLYQGFDLCAPNTSVSMTINGPAPTILAMFLNTAIEQQVEKFKNEHKKDPTESDVEKIKGRALQVARGTVQADILKEDQAQNTCIFSIDFALRMMADIQEYFVKNKVRNFYSVSISGYHIAEAGANPITQLAFTLANGFTYVEYYLSRGMAIDEFAPNLSFFFSNGLDPEYSVLGRVARRIWAIAMKNRYGANERSQKLKYHIQTSGRSLHSQDIEFNDIRTTLQALTAYYDHCNSLHTNAYDEAITTPSEESVRRAMAIQLIITREFGPSKNQNPMQGSFLFEELTDLVEEAVLAEFQRLDERGGVLGAMETQYQRGKIQSESLHYETLKHSGELPIIGVNTFLNPKVGGAEIENLTLARSSEEEKTLQIQSLRTFQQKHSSEATLALTRLQEVARSGGNLFEELMRSVKVASLGQISKALYEVGGKYRRNL